MVLLQGLSAQDLADLSAHLEKLPAIEHSSSFHRITLKQSLLYRGSFLQNSNNPVQEADLTFTLRRQGDLWSWISCESDVPAMQSRLQVEAVEVNHVRKGDGDQLELSWSMGRREPGRDMGRGENAHSMMKAKKRSVLDWSIGGRKRMENHPHRALIQLSSKQGDQHLQLTFRGAVGASRPVTEPPPQKGNNRPVSWEELGAWFPLQRRDLELKLIRESGQWRALAVDAPSWNKAVHRLVDEQLTVQGDRLQGHVVVEYHSDLWVPRDKKVRRVTYHVEGHIADGRCKGRFRSEGDWGEFEDEFYGSIGQLSRGRYTLDGADGKREGEAMATIASFTMLTGDDPWLMAQQRRREEKGGREPLQPLREGSGDLSQRAIALLKGTQVTPELEGKPDLSGLESAPEMTSFGAAPSVFTWMYPREWKALGPFVERQDQDPAPLWSEVALEPDSTYKDRRLTLAQWVEHPRRWVAALERERSVFLPNSLEDSLWLTDGKMSSYKPHPLAQAYRSREMGRRSCVWYGARTFEVENEEKVWVALQGRDFLALYLDGEKVWSTAKVGDREQMHLIPLTLKPGQRELMVRCGKTKMGYFLGDPKDRTQFRLFIGRGPIPASTSAKGSMEEVYLDGAGLSSQRKFKSEPPLVFDEAKGLNVGWTLPLKGNHGTPSSDGERLYLSGLGGALMTIHPTTGRVLWERASKGESPPRRPALLRDGLILSGGGELTKYGKEGDIVWSIPLKHAGAPLVVGDLVIAQVKRTVKIPQKKGSKTVVFRDLRAFHVKDGASAWSVVSEDTTPGFAAVRPLGGGVVLATAGGLCIDARSGAVEPWNLLGTSREGRYSFAVVGHGDRAYFTSRVGQKAFRFFRDGEGSLVVVPIFSQSRSGWGGAPGLVHGGQLWVPRLADEYHDHHPVPWSQLDVYDLSSGQHLAKAKPTFDDSVAPGPAIAAGNLIVVYDSGAPAKLGLRNPRAKVAFYSDSDRPVQLHQHAFEGKSRMMGAPLVVGESIYYTLHDRLICVAFTEGGLQSQRETLARHHLQMLGRPPAMPPMVELTPSSKPLKGPIHRLAHGPSPNQWWRLGPLPRAAEDFGDAWTELTPTLGEAPEGLAVPAVFEAVEAENIRPGPKIPVYRNNRVRYVPIQNLDLLGAVGGKSQSRSYFHTVLRVDEAGVFRLDSGSRSSTVVISGHQVKNGEWLSMAKGDYPVLVKVELGRVPPVGRILFKFNLMEMEDPHRAHRSAMEAFHLRKSMLEDIVKHLPGSAQAIQAQKILSELSVQP